jgi:hypothetical protein
MTNLVDYPHREENKKMHQYDQREKNPKQILASPVSVGVVLILVLADDARPVVAARR